MVEMPDLAAGRGAGRTALHDGQAGPPPLQLHETLDARALADRPEKRLGHRHLVERAERGMYEQAQPRPSVRRFVLDELIIRGTAAEARGQRLLEHGHDVGVEQRDAAGVELLEAPNVPEVPP